MNNKINPIRTYNLVNTNGNKLQLQLGLDVEINADFCKGDPDKGYRWCFIGTKIPMPIRSGTWFNGFPERTMLEWLAKHGWVCSTIVNMNTGNAIVYAIDFSECGTKAKADDWIPVSSGKYPKDGEYVNVTFLDYYDNTPHCGDAAFRHNGNWYWCHSHNSVQVEITAWKPLCEPYKGE